jgi:hypothetical protein
MWRSEFGCLFQVRQGSAGRGLRRLCVSWGVIRDVSDFLNFVPGEAIGGAPDQELSAQSEDGVPGPATMRCASIAVSGRRAAPCGREILEGAASPLQQLTSLRNAGAPRRPCGNSPFRASLAFRVGPDQKSLRAETNDKIPRANRCSGTPIGFPARSRPLADGVIGATPRLPARGILAAATGSWLQLEGAGAACYPPE